MVPKWPAWMSVSVFEQSDGARLAECAYRRRERLDERRDASPAGADPVQFPENKGRYCAAAARNSVLPARRASAVGLVPRRASRTHVRAGNMLPILFGDPTLGEPKVSGLPSEFRDYLPLITRCFDHCHGSDIAEDFRLEGNVLRAIDFNRPSSVVDDTHGPRTRDAHTQATHPSSTP